MLMKPLRDLVLAALLSCVTLASAQAFTEQEEQQFSDILGRAVDISQGTGVNGATIAANGATMLKGEDACAFSRLLNADEICDVSAIVLPPDGAGIDSIYYSEPEDIGYVNMDDWTDEVSSQIDEIWDSYVEGSKAQSERIGYQVLPVKWVLYPTLNKASKVMTYGVLLDFGGQEVINLITVKFTKSGYVKMEVVTDDEMLAARSSSYDLASVYASNTYAPNSGLRYADFKDGDKLAQIGAVGVLASVVGVKYANKGTLAAIGAAIVVFAKKLWFLFLVIPLAIWGLIKKFFGRT